MSVSFKTIVAILGIFLICSIIGGVAEGIYVDSSSMVDTKETTVVHNAVSAIGDLSWNPSSWPTIVTSVIDIVKKTATWDFVFFQNEINGEDNWIAVLRPFFWCLSAGIGAAFIFNIIGLVSNALASIRSLFRIV